MRFDFNIIDFKKAVEKIEMKSSEARRKAFFAVGSEMVDDFVNTSPTPQIDTGHMRGSWWISAGTNVLQKSTKGSGKINIPDTSGAGDDELRVGFMTPYAEEQEKGFWNSGRKIRPGIKTLRAGAAPGWMRLKIPVNKAKWLKTLETAYLENL